MKQLVCKVDELASGEMKSFEIRNRKIVLVRNGDEFHAVSGICPHQAALMGEGHLKGTNLTTAEVGHYCYGKDRQIITCPWHHYEFAVTTGVSLFDSEYQLNTYTVEISNDKVLIDI